MVSAQRGSYAGGSRSTGYKDRFLTSSPSDNGNTLQDRFGASNSTNNSTVQSTTERLPHDAYGDQFAFNRLSQLPQERQPFWLLNYKAIEAHRGTPGSPFLQNQMGGGFAGAMPANVPPQSFNANAIRGSFMNPNGLATDQQNFASRIDNNQGSVGAPFNNQMNTNNFGFGIPQGTRGSYAG